ncbi:MAG: NAD(P)H-binding protein [Cryomorphaceae bacterium]
MKPVLAIAGATGFIGRWFIQQYSEKYQIIALSRGEVENTDDDPVEWRRVNLYSLSSTSEALAGADYALYLVHSMQPSSRLTQGSFEDTDLLLADNFARAAEERNLKQLVFIGGILPKDSSDFSTHLRSRYETEQTLSSGKTPMTAIRASIIIGAGGSSFRIVRKLTERLPVMACPQWCESPSQPIDIRNMLEIIYRTLGNEELYDKAIEVGSPKIHSYMDLLKITSKKLGKKRWIFSIPFFTLGFSKLWVAKFSDSSTTFVSPLIESLRHDMRVDESKNPYPDLDYTPIEESVANALTEKSPPLPKRHYGDRAENTVRSVQRLPNPGQKSAAWVARVYPDWLSKKFTFFLNAGKGEDKVRFILFGKTLLELSFIDARSDEKRRLFFITGGILAKRVDYGWLEFRSVLDNRYIIAAIHEFVPRLPWYLYRFSQAVVHLMIMKSFGKFLKKR